MDCSELTYRVFEELGITIPQIGDIVFLLNQMLGKLLMLNIVSEVNEKGEIKYIHAPGTGRLVEEKSI